MITAAQLRAAAAIVSVKAGQGFPHLARLADALDEEAKHKDKEKESDTTQDQGLG